MAGAVLHGLIQQAERQALRLPWRIVPLGSMYAAEKYQHGDWLFVCRFELHEEAADFLAGKLSQEGPNEPLRG